MAGQRRLSERGLMIYKPNKPDIDLIRDFNQTRRNSATPILNTNILINKVSTGENFCCASGGSSAIASGSGGSGSASGSGSGGGGVGLGMGPGRKVQIRIDDGGNHFSLLPEDPESSLCVPGLVGLRRNSDSSMINPNETSAISCNKERSKSFDFTNPTGLSPEQKLTIPPATPTRNTTLNEQVVYSLDAGELGQAIENHLKNDKRRATFSDIYSSNEPLQISRPRSSSQYYSRPLLSLPFLSRDECVESTPLLPHFTLTQVTSDFDQSQVIQEEDEEQNTEQQQKQQQKRTLCSVVYKFFTDIIKGF